MKRELLVGAVRVRILESFGEAVQGFQRVALAWRVVVDDAVERHIVPRGGRLLPEVAGRRAHFVRPVGRFIESLSRPQNLFDMRAGEAAELRVGDRGHDPMARLAPGEGG